MTAPPSPDPRVRVRRPGRPSRHRRVAPERRLLRRFPTTASRPGRTSRLTRSRTLGAAVSGSARRRLRWSSEGEVGGSIPGAGRLGVRSADRRRRRRPPPTVVVVGRRRTSAGERRLGCGGSSDSSFAPSLPAIRAPVERKPSSSSISETRAARPAATAWTRRGRDAAVVKVKLGRARPPCAPRGVSTTVSVVIR